MKSFRVMSFYAALVVLAFALMGCSVPAPLLPTMKYVDTPGINETSVVEIGSPLTIKSKIYSYKGYYLREPVVVRKQGLRVELDIGDYVGTEADEKWIYYYPREPEMGRSFSFGLPTELQVGLRRNRERGHIRAFHKNSSLITGLLQFQGNANWTLMR